MLWGVKTVTPPGPALQLDELKDHLRITHTAEDGYLSGLARAAEGRLEDWLARAWVSQTLELYLEDFPAEDWIKLPRWPVSSITSIKYTEEGGTEQTFSSSSYLLAAELRPARIYLEAAASWPSSTLDPGTPVVIRFVAGHADPPSLPEDERRAILFLAAHWYQRREPVAAARRATLATVPIALSAIMTDLKIRGIRYGD